MTSPDSQRDVFDVPDEIAYLQHDEHVSAAALGGRGRCARPCPRAPPWKMTSVNWLTDVVVDADASRAYQRRATGSQPPRRTWPPAAGAQVVVRAGE